jgi:hypothetical protein
LLKKELYWALLLHLGWNVLVEKFFKPFFMSSKFSCVVITVYFLEKHSVHYPFLDSCTLISGNEFNGITSFLSFSKHSFPNLIMLGTILVELAKKRIEKQYQGLLLPCALFISMSQNKKLL